MRFKELSGWAITFVASLVLAATAAQANALTAADRSCAFVNKATLDGGEGVIAWTKQNGPAWPGQQMDLLTGSLNVLKRFQFVSGQVYSIANFAPLAEEHLVVIETKRNGAFYFRLTYEKYGNEMRFVNLYFQSDWKVMVSRPVVQAPVAVPCR